MNFASVPMLLTAAFAAALQHTVTASEQQASDILDIIQPRVVGGQPVESADAYPFYSRIDANGQFICGGSLVWPDYVLTAAHCVEEALGLPQANTGFSVAVGATEQSGTGESFGIIEKWKHPKWDPDSGLQWDLALIKLDDISNAVPAELNDMFTFPTSGDDLTVIGMGLEYENGSLPGQLLEAAVQFIDHDECKSDFPFWLSWMVTEENMICSQGETEEGKTDACQGDSGGPLIISGTNTQVGVVSWGRGCGSNAWYDWDGSPGVYARVSSANAWIKETICTNSAVTPPNDFCRVKEIVPCEEPTNSFMNSGVERTCEWLGGSWFRRSWTCKTNGVAKDACPETCGGYCPKN